MKIKKLRLPLLSRKQKTLIFFSIVILVVYVLISTGLPITPQAAFRLAEKANLLNPGKILGTESATPDSKNSIIIAQNDTACITFAYQDLKWYTSDDLAFRKKTGDLTFVSIDSFLTYTRKDDSFLYNDDYKHYLPVILFDDFPNATRAELDITLYRTEEDTMPKKLYHVTAKRQSNGYFLFYLQWNTSNIEDDLYIHNLGMALGKNIVVYDFFAPSLIRLYDKDDQLILERKMDIVRD